MILACNTRKIKLEVSKDTIRGKITGGIKPDIARYREKKKGNRIQKRKKKKGGKSNIEQEGNCYGIWEYEKVVGSKNVNEKAIGRLSSRSFDLRPQSRSARFFRWRRFFFFFFPEAASAILLGQLQSRCRDNNHC